MITSDDMEKQTSKASKPAMEKRRRARINESLQQLKALVLDGMNKNNPRHSKLEKADILEMTVRYLRNVQRQQVKASMETDPAVITQYRTGFAECMGEVSRYLGGAMEENPEVRARLIGHLAGYCTSAANQKPQQQSRYAAVTSTPSPGTSQVLSPSSSTSSVGGRSSAPTGSIPPSSSVQHQQRHHSQPVPMQVGFPTPPLSGGGLPPYPVTLMTSPVVEGARTRGTSQVLPSQVPQLQPQRLSPAKGATEGPVPKVEVPVSEVKQAMIAQSLPIRTPPQAPQPTGDVITLILPSQSLPGGQVPTHLIPVYAQEPGKGPAPPLGFSFGGTESVPSSSAPQSSSSNTPRACADSTPSPKVAMAAPAVIPTNQPAGWTAIPIPTAQLISPQAGAVAPSSTSAPPLAFSIPFNAKIAPPGAAVPTKQPAEQMGRPIRLPGVFALNADASRDSDPMWRPW